MAEPDQTSPQQRLDIPEAEPPVPTLPQTSRPAQFNQQINIQRIPPKAWEKLSADQMMELSKDLFKMMERSEDRNFHFAVEQARQENSASKRNTLIGGGIASLGIVAMGTSTPACRPQSAAAPTRSHPTRGHRRSGIRLAIESP